MNAPASKHVFRNAAFAIVCILVIVSFVFIFDYYSYKKNLISAIASGNKNKAIELIESRKFYGVNFTYGDYHATPLWEALSIRDADKGNIKIELVSYLLKNGAIPGYGSTYSLKGADGKTTKYIFGPLCQIIAVYPIHQMEIELKILEMLLEHGADPNLGNHDNGFFEGTPLIEAIRRCPIEYARLLIKYKADVNIKNSLGWDAFSCALVIASGENKERGIEEVKLLVDSGYKIDFDKVQFKDAPLRTIFTDKNQQKLLPPGLVQYLKSILEGNSLNSDTNKTSDTKTSDRGGEKLPGSPEDKPAAPAGKRD